MSQAPRTMSRTVSMSATSVDGDGPDPTRALRTRAQGYGTASPSCWRWTCGRLELATACQARRVGEARGPDEGPSSASPSHPARRAIGSPAWALPECTGGLNGAHVQVPGNRSAPSRIARMYPLDVGPSYEQSSGLTRCAGRGATALEGPRTAEPGEAGDRG